MKLEMSVLCLRKYNKAAAWLKNIHHSWMSVFGCTDQKDTVEVWTEVER